MNSRYQYIVTFLALRDSIAVQALAMAVMLIAPLPLLRRWPWLVYGYAGLLVVLAYGAVLAGVLTDAH